VLGYDGTVGFCSRVTGWSPARQALAKFEELYKKCVTRDTSVPPERARTVVTLD
jgi:hypothetical protein